MNCKQAQLQIDGYIDQELGIRAMADMEAHLAECVDCRREANEARSLKMLLGGAREVEPPVGFEDRLVQRVMRVAEPEPVRARPAFGWIAFAGVTAAAITFAFLNRTPHESAIVSQEKSLAHEIGQDMVYTAGSDPLGPRAVFLSSYDRR